MIWPTFSDTFSLRTACGDVHVRSGLVVDTLDDYSSEHLIERELDIITTLRLAYLKRSLSVIFVDHDVVRERSRESFAREITLILKTCKWCRN